MRRLDDDAVALHLEVALSGASGGMMADLLHQDRYRRAAAVSTLSRYLADRLRCFRILDEAPPLDHPSLFTEMRS